MTYLDPQESFDQFRDRVVTAFREQFPIKGKLQTVELEHIEVEDRLHPFDIRSQQKAKVQGETWAAPVYATVSLKENSTGKVIDKRRVRIAEIPKMTNRYSYIVDGQEYQVDSQWQLKPGVYARRKQNGELESQFNIAGHGRFDLVFDPAKKHFLMEYNKSRIPLYPIMKVMGVSDDELEKSWGKDIFQANKNAKMVSTALERFYKTDTKQVAPSKDVAAQHVYNILTKAKLRPDVTEITLGKAVDHVSGEALHLATNKLLKVQAGHPEDDRDSLIFKDLRGVGDYVADHLQKAVLGIRKKAERKLNIATDVRDLVRFDYFNAPIKAVFGTSLARVASQINPAEMVSASMQTSIMGPGGIKSDQQITAEAKMVNASHFGFLDPINTPEGDKTGITLRLPMGVQKIGKEARLPLYNLRTNVVEMVSPKDVLTKKVVLPDQVQWDGGKPKPLGATVKAVGEGNNIEHISMKDADYVLRHPSYLFSVTGNLIPFMGNNSGGRAGMAARHMEQSISLLHRKAPLVQVSTGLPTPGMRTFEEFMGQQSSHQSPVDGVVMSVKDDSIHVKDSAGKVHDVHLYNNYPLNDAKGVYHSTARVSSGDKVHKGQLLADTNFTDKGVLSLGTNLRVAFIPYKGYNFEDGVVISKSAAEKLTSTHLHKPTLVSDDKMKFDVKSFQNQHPGAFTKEQYSNIGADGIIRVGSTVHPGDPLIVAMKPFELKERTGISAFRKSLSGAHTDRSLRWESEFPGEVVAVHKVGKYLKVHVRTQEPMQVGDKISGRHGNKGIVTAILGDHEMPHTKDGKHVEVLLNPSGIPGRMNVGQVLETAAGKIAEKLGKPYHVNNFDPNVPDAVAKVQAELKQHGLSDKEELFDPKTGKSLGSALVGPKHMLKLVHQVEKKMAVRSGMGLVGMPGGPGYDLNLIPNKGGHSGGQALGALGVYALLAHGAKANLREMQTFKSEGEDLSHGAMKAWPSQHRDVWERIQMGLPLPTPKSTFAWQKFEDMLRAAGVNVDKKGHDIALTPMTNAQVLKMSAGELTKPGEMVYSKPEKDGTLRPIPGGIFDERLTGGHGGRKWSHIRLAEPLPNPLFETPIQLLTGISSKKFEGILHGELGVSPSGAVVDPAKGVTGGAGIKILLDRVDVKKSLAEAQKSLEKAPPSLANRIFKKVRYLKALEELGSSPSEAYMLHNLPVLPPAMRPLTVLGNDIKYEDLNGLYKDFALINDKLRNPTVMKNFTDEMKKSLRVDYYDGVRSLFGAGVPYDHRKEKGLLHLIAGESPKKGYFQAVLTSRRQDLSMRSTIVPEPSLGLDEVGVPREAALTLFRPFLIRQLVQQGTAPTPLTAQKVLLDVHKGKDNPQVWKALEKVMEERPVLLKRDPALHKYSIQGFRPRIVEGSAIKIHPLVTGGFNADFDGDTMALFVPITHEAITEARNMFPTKNLFSEASGKVMYQPTLESALGLYKLSVVGKDTAHKFSSDADAVKALEAGKVSHTDVVHVGGVRTTPGRVLLSQALPQAMRQKIRTDFDYTIHKGGLDSLLTTLAKNHSGEFGGVVDSLKNLGNEAAYGIIRSPLTTGPIAIGTHTLSLSDFHTDRSIRDPIIKETAEKVQTMMKSTSIPKGDKDRRAVDMWSEAEKRIKEQHAAKAKTTPTNLVTMWQAGVKPGWEQYKQLSLSPMLLKDSTNRTIPTPVTKSYSEGLDVAGYWVATHGARRGAVMKVQEVRDPGYMSKLLQNTAMSLVVDTPDCGTTKGVSLHVDSKDVHDRFLAQDFTANGLHIPAGTMMTPDVVGKIRSVDRNAQVIVRSPLKCEHDKGLCQKCAGAAPNGPVFALGTNLGVMAAHAVGERAVQLPMKEFHVGGVATGGGKVVNNLVRFQHLTLLPQKIPNAATLAMKSGTIEKIEPDATGVTVHIGGHVHHVGKDANGMALHHTLPLADKNPDFVSWSAPKVGQRVEAGAVLSDPNRTVVNPHDLFRATGSIEKVQNHLTNEIFDLYKDEGVLRRNIEVVVKAMSNLTRVEDPGDHPTLLRGQFYPTSVVRRLNETELKGKEPIRHTPVLKGIDMMPLEMQEDWIAKLQHLRLTQSLPESAATNAHSSLHGLHPIPGLAYGAQFGMTAKDSKLPGHEHLRNVPSHHY